MKPRLDGIDSSRNVIQVRQGFHHRRHAGGNVLGALFGGMAERQHLLGPAGAANNTGHVGIAAFIEAAVDHRPHAHLPAPVQLFSQPLGLAGRYRETEQGRVASGEASSAPA